MAEFEGYNFDYKVALTDPRVPDEIRGRSLMIRTFSEIKELEPPLRGFRIVTFERFRDETDG